MLISRRPFLIGAATLLGSALADDLGFAQVSGKGTGGADATAGLEDLARGMEGAQDIGRAFLASPYAAAPTSREALVSALRRRVGPGMPATASDWAEAVRAAVVEDFRNERICLLDDWYLSLTECQLAGLSVLLNPDASTVVASPVAGPAETSLDTARLEDFVDVRDWGPRGTSQSEPFMVQADGSSGMWFIVPNAPRLLEVYFDGTKVTRVSRVGDTLTLALDKLFLQEHLATIGEHDIVLVDPLEGRKQVVGRFKVNPALCPPTDWGPRQTGVDRPFNVQPDGSVAFWMKADCFAPGTELWLGQTKLQPTFNGGLVTATTRDLSFLSQPGTLDLVLALPSANGRLVVGQFQVAQ